MTLSERENGYKPKLDLDAWPYLPYTSIESVSEYEYFIGGCDDKQ